jgi:hypothetical protein
VEREVEGDTYRNGISRRVFDSRDGGVAAEEGGAAYECLD